MPLLVILFIGILAFGLFDLTLGRPLPVTDGPHTSLDGENSPTESTEPPSIPTVAASEVANCDPDDHACQLVTLYRFVLTTVALEAPQRPWLHLQQHPTRTLSRKSGDPLDIAVLLSSLLDQQHIRNYLIVLPEDSYVLACDITASALHQAGGNWQPPSSVLDTTLLDGEGNPTPIPIIDRIDAYAVNIDDAPCPCLLLDPSEPANQSPGAPLPMPAGSLRSALDRRGHRHAVVISGL